MFIRYLYGKYKTGGLLAVKNAHYLIVKYIKFLLYRNTGIFCEISSATTAPASTSLALYLPSNEPLNK